MAIKNTKELLQFTFECMGKLDKGEMSVQQAREQSNLIKQANNILKHKLDKAQIQMKLIEHQEMFGTSIAIEEIEEYTDVPAIEAKNG